MRVLQTTKFTHVATGSRGDVVMSFDPESPLVVNFDFDVEGVAAKWMFSRDLVAEGCYSPNGVGDGDCRFWADNDGTTDMLTVLISSPEGEAVLDVPRQSVLFFLETCDAQVRRGSKAEDMALAEQVELLLGALFCG